MHMYGRNKRRGTRSVDLMRFWSSMPCHANQTEAAPIPCWLESIIIIPWVHCRHSKESSIIPLSFQFSSCFSHQTPFKFVLKRLLFVGLEKKKNARAFAGPDDLAPSIYSWFPWWLKQLQVSLYVARMGRNSLMSKCTTWGGHVGDRKLRLLGNARMLHAGPQPLGLGNLQLLFNINYNQSPLSHATVYCSYLMNWVLAWKRL